jgi:hypothetical protein
MIMGVRFLNAGRIVHSVLFQNIRRKMITTLKSYLLIKGNELYFLLSANISKMVRAMNNR